VEPNLEFLSRTMEEEQEYNKGERHQPSFFVETGNQEACVAGSGTPNGLLWQEGETERKKL